MKVALVTGPSSGLGEVTARRLATAGYHVIAAGRSSQRVGRVVDAILAGGGSAEYLPLDLSSLESVREASRVVDRSDRQIGVLINNAGIGIGRGSTIDGFELHFGVNHLGHFLLTGLLSHRLDPGARIVTVSSAMHHRVRGVDFGRAQHPTRSFLGIEEYAQSKLANVLFVRELARRHPEWHAYAVHPGFADTGLIPRWSRPFLKSRLITAEQGADTQIWCATSTDVAKQSGLYYVRRQVTPPSAQAQDGGLARELWEQSERWAPSERIL